jgi:pyruvate dehydrogenase E2 component (dihydrolipoamide acetyltransferase)
VTDIVMPRLSDSMEEGTILTWLKQVGDEVAVGDELVEIETDKANMAYEADVAGTLNEILAKEGETLPIGSPIARIGDPGEQGNGDRPAGPVSDEASPETGSGKASSSPPAADAVEVTAPAAAAVREDGERVKASPLARRLAKERGLDLSKVDGSGPGGRIVKSDVEKAEAGDAAGTAPSPQ